MPRFIKVLGMLLFILTALFLNTVPIYAQTSPDCTLCHGNVPAGFLQPAVQEVDRNSACLPCHGPSSHRYLVSLPQGNFQSADSLNTPIPKLHQLHAGDAIGKWQSADQYCGTCHSDAKCTKCHVTVPHNNHSSSAYQPNATFRTGDGLTVSLNTLNCTLSQCHGRLLEIKRVETNPDATQKQLCLNCHDSNLIGHPVHDLPVGVDGFKPAFMEAQPVNCQNCHENEIVLEHKANVLHQIGVPGQSLCVKCHGNSAYANIIMVENVYNPTMCSSCHTDKVADIFSGNHLPLHKATDTLDTAYPVVSLHSDNCNQCHANTIVSANIKTMAFGNTTSYACTDCHADGKAPVAKHKATEDTSLTTDFHPDCNTCHDPVKVDIKGRIGQLAKAAGYSCFDCHAGTPLASKPGHMVVNDLGGGNTAQNITGFHPGCSTCHNQQIKSKVIELKALATYKCSDCHNSQTGVAGIPNHQAQLDATSPMISLPTYHQECQTCHGNVKVSNNIQNLKGQSNYRCDSCHNGQDAKKYAHVSKTVSSGVDYNTAALHPTCDTCHTKLAAKPVITSLLGQSGYLCTQCHNAVVAPKPNHSALYETDGAALNTESFHLNCDTCHNDAGAQTKINVVHGTSGYLCATCHNGEVAMNSFHLAKLAAEGADTDTKVFHSSCNTCHGKPEVDTKIRTLKGTSGYLCNDCHGSIAPAANHSAKTYGNGISYVTTDVHNGCSKCHGKPAVDTKIKALASTSGYLCTDCHNGTVATAPKHLSKADITGPNKDTTELHTNCDTCHNTTNAIPSIMGLKGTSGYLCSQCHDGIIAGQPGHQAKLDSTDIQATGVTAFHPASCETCHANSSVSGTIGTLKGTTGYTCSQCHDGNQAKQANHQAKFKSTDASNLATVGYHPAGCTTCHTAAVNSKVAEASASTNVYECGLCHNNSVAGKPSHSAKLDNTSSLSDTSNVHPMCNTCHGNTSSRITNLQTIYEDLKNKVKSGEISSYLCSDCHGDITARHLSPSDLSGNLNIITCSWCHSSQLLDTHLKPTVKLSKALSCESCHGNAAPLGVRNAINLKQKDCTSCHNGAADAVSSPHPDSQYIPKHVGILSAFTGITGYPSPDCVKCHNDNNGNAPNIVTYHMGINDKIIGCKSCHTDNDSYKSAVASQNTNCSGCHLATMENRHVAFHTVDSTTSTTTGECLSCHAVPTVTINTLIDVHKKQLDSTVICDTCHATTARAQVSDAIAANNKACESCHTGAGHTHSVTAYETDANLARVSCANCHATDASDMSTELSKLHADRGFGCATCHNVIFEVQNKIIVKDGSFNIPVCSACHNGTLAPSMSMYPEHSGTTTSHSSATGIGDYTFASNVNCANCHTSLTTGAYALSPVHQNVDCNKCHTSTVEAVQSVISGNWSRQTTKAPYSCADCHNAVNTAATTKHQPVHTASSFTLDTTDVENCTTCHSTKVLTDLHVGKTNQAGATMTCDSCHNSADTKVITSISQQARSATPIYSCDSCHTLHDNGDHSVAIPAGLTLEPNLKCAQCHDNDAATAGVTDLATEHTRRVNAETGQNYTCDICHNSTKTEVNNAIATKNKTCSACHTAGWHSDLTTPHSSTYVTNPAFLCANCHGNVLSDKSLHPDAIAGTITIGGGPVSYKLFRGLDGVSFTQVATSPTNNFSDTGLTASTQYYYQVAAVDQAGNVSPKSNVAFATAAIQETTTTVNPTSAQYRNQSSNGDTASDSSFSSIRPSALTRITDGRDSDGGSYDVRVQENGSNDRWIYVRIANDAKDDTKVVLNVRASWRDRDSAGNLLIYPYQSNGTSINAAGVVNYKISNPSYNGNFTTYSIDVTAAAHTMDNFGFMKFRIKPGIDGSRRDAYVSEVDYVLTTGTAGASGTSVGTPGTATITGADGDSTAPSTPASLFAQGISTSQIDLNWNASTDPAQTVNQPGQSNCLKCHDSNQLNIMTAITTQKNNCDACHTSIHGDPNVLHNTTFVLNPTMACTTCHQSRVDNEHLSRKSTTTGLQYTCDTCHKSTDPLVQGAITNNDTRCSSCHPTRHTNVQSVHVANYFKDDTVVCENCHTTTKTEFTSATTARHAIPGTTAMAEGGTYVSPWTMTSTTNCRDCHNTTNGTYYGKLLVAAYTSSSANLCFRCHNQNSVTSGNGSKFSDHGEHDKYSCQACHSTKPHGQSTQKHFIALKGQPNAASTNTITKFIHNTGSYSESDCTASCAGEHDGGR